MTVGRFLKNPSRRKPRSDHGDLKSVSKRCMNWLKRKARIECLEKQVKDSLRNLGCQKKQKPQPKCVLVRMALIKSIIKLPMRHKRLCMEKVKKIHEDTHEVSQDEKTDLHQLCNSVQRCNWRNRIKFAIVQILFIGE